MRCHSHSRSGMRGCARVRRRSLATLLLVLALAFACGDGDDGVPSDGGGSGDSGPRPTGSQFQVNTYTMNNQFISSVAAARNGDFTVVWTSNGSGGSDTSERSIQGQRYASNGNRRGDEFQVNTYTTSYQQRPSIAAADDGRFVVVWQSDGSSGADTSDDSIQGQRYASDGSPVGGEFLVNTYTTSYQISPAVAAASNGDFVVVWKRTNLIGGLAGTIRGQRFGSDGNPRGGEFQVNASALNQQRLPDVSAEANGDFVVVWTNYGAVAGGVSEILGQRYASDGSPRGGAFQVNSHTTNQQTVASISTGENGDFVVVWESLASESGDTFPSSVQGQRFASNGSRRGVQFQVNTYTPGRQGGPSVSVASDGGFTVVWDGYGSGENDDAFGSIQGQHFASNGSPVGDEFEVNTYTTSYQFYASVASMGDGFVVVWDSMGSFGSDTSEFSVQAQRFSE